MNKTRFKGAGVSADNQKFGSSTFTGGATVASGMAAVEQVIASLSNAGTAAGNPFALQATALAGNLIFTARQQSGALATTPATVNWIAVGTP
jgi:hypothetical protein